MSRFFKFIFAFVFVFFLGLNLQAADLSRKVEFKTISEELSGIETRLKDDTLSLENVDVETTHLYNLSNNLSETKRFNERELRLVQKQLDALGEKTEGELRELSNKRSELNEELVLLKSRIAETDILQVKIDNLNMLILNFKSQKVFGDLMNKKEALFVPQTFLSVTKSLVVFLLDIARSPIHWYQRLDENAKSYVLTYTIPSIFILVVVVWFGMILKRFILKNWGYKKEIENPNEFQRILVSIANGVAYGVVPAFIIAGILGWVVGSKIFSAGLLGLVLTECLIWLLYIVLVRAVAWAILAPSRENWRPIAISNKKALKITHSVNLCMILIAVTAVLQRIAELATYEPILVSFLIVLCSAAKAFAIVLLTTKIMEPNEDISFVSEDEKEETLDEKRSFAFKVNVVTTILSIGVVGIGLFGYPNLSVYILNRYIISVILFGFFLVAKNLLERTIKYLSMTFLWGKSFHLRRTFLTRVNFVLSMFVNPILTLFFIFGLLNLWGFSNDFLLHLLKKLIFGFSIGGIHISLIAVIFGILAFLISYSLVKIFRKHLMQNVFTHLEIDEGIRHSLDSFVGFIGVVLSVLLAIVVMGGNLTNLTLIAGALSVGIGFGLQNVINNFVSGIIILFERPFKVGDWVTIDGEEGKIKQINIRSTELETFRRTSVIVPNATLLSSSVINRTHDNNWARLSVSVGVAYGSDVEKVRDILIECAFSNSKVLKRPAPYVVFKDFGSSSLDFELFWYTSNIWEGWVVPSELRFAINKRFQEENIEIPFPQMVVYNGDKKE